MELTSEQIAEIKGTMYLDIEDTKAEKHTSERRITHWISTPDLDRGRDIMKPKGMNPAEFELTRTVFADHDYSKIIGSNVKLLATNDGVKATTYFTDKTPFAVDRYNLHLEDVLKSWSIGFAPERGKDGTILQDSIEWDDQTGRRVFHQWKLLEYSDTGIPMNPNCLDIAKSICKSAEMKQEITEKEYRLSIDTQLLGYQKEIAELKTLIEQLKSGTNTNELKKEIAELKSRLEKYLGNENEKPDYNLIRKQVRSALVGSFEAQTGRKFKQ